MTSFSHAHIRQTPTGTRTEHDLLGDLEVPADAYYGIHTMRAVENFAISGIAISTHDELVRAIVAVKSAAAQANRDLGLLDDELAEAIITACTDIRNGSLHPVIPEAVSQVAYEVIGNDVAITMAAEAGQLQLNAFEPLIAHKLLESITHLSAAVDTLAIRCIPGITANVEHMRDYVDRSIGLVTALNPHIGYDAATALAARALNSDRTIIELVVESGLLTRTQLDHILSPANLVRPSVRPS